MHVTCTKIRGVLFHHTYMGLLHWKIRIIQQYSDHTMG